jgi:hypothetical protein
MEIGETRAHFSLASIIAIAAAIASFFVGPLGGLIWRPLRPRSAF